MNEVTNPFLDTSFFLLEKTR